MNRRYLVMRSVLTLIAFGVAVLLVAHPLVYAQEKAADQKVFEGQLTKVDATAKSIAVKGSTGPEMLFNYDDQTQVIGPEKNIQGLAGKSGAALKVTYRQDKGMNWATRIEILEKAPGR
jgi:predicted RNA-binding protein